MNTFSFLNHAIAGFISVHRQHKRQLFRTVWFVALFLIFTHCHNSDPSTAPQPSNTSNLSTQQSHGISSTNKITNISGDSTQTFSSQSSTLPNDLIPPSWEIEPNVISATYHSIDLSFSLSELGSVYYVIEVLGSSQVPTIEYLTSKQAPWVITSALTEVTFSIDQLDENNSLEPDKEYVIYLIAVDQSGNIQQEPFELEVATDEYPYLEWYKNYPQSDFPQATSVDIFYKLKQKDAKLYYYFEPCTSSNTACTDPKAILTSQAIKDLALAQSTAQVVDTKADIAGTFSINSLAGLTEYIIYLVGEDLNGVLQIEPAYLILETAPEIQYSDVIISYIFQSSDQWQYQCCPNDAMEQDYDVNAHMRFIELRNISDVQVDISGWSLQFYHNLINNQTYEPDRVELVTFPSGTTIESGKSFLVGVNYVHDLLKPDFNLFEYAFPVGLDTNLLNDSGKGIALVRGIVPADTKSDELIEDQMGYVVDSSYFPYFGEGDLGYIKKDNDACGANFIRKNWGFRDTNTTSEDWEAICEANFIPPMNSESITTIAPPQVLSSYPKEGETYNSEVIFDTFIIEFNEDMNFAHGYIELVGGEEVLRNPNHFYQIIPSFDLANQRWTSPRTYAFDLVGLDSSTHYQFELKEFMDLRGNILVAENGEADQPYLKDVYLDVYTAPAMPPHVLYTLPSDNEIGVCDGSIRCPDPNLTTVEIIFSEPMNKDVGTASISGGSASIATTQYIFPRSSDGKTFTVNLTGLTELQSYTLTFSGFKDIFGYELDPFNIDGKLGSNGMLDLTTQPVVYDSRLQITEAYMAHNQERSQYVELWNNTASSINWDEDGSWFLMFVKLLPKKNSPCSPEPCVTYENPSGLTWNQEYRDYHNVVQLQGGHIEPWNSTSGYHPCWIHRASQYGPPPGCAIDNDACIITYCTNNPTAWYCGKCHDPDVWIVGGSTTYKSLHDQLHTPDVLHGWNYDYQSKGGAILLFRCDTCHTDDFNYSTHSYVWGDQFLRFSETPMDQMEQFPRDITIQQAAYFNSEMTEINEAKSVQLLDVVLIYSDYSFDIMGYHGNWFTEPKNEFLPYAFEEYRQIFGTIPINREDRRVKRVSPINKISTTSTLGLGKFPD